MRAQDPARVEKSVGRRIAELRQQRGETQADLAERMNVSIKYLQRLERGTNMTIDTLVRLANLLGASVTVLFEPPKTRTARRGRPPST